MVLRKLEMSCRVLAAFPLGVLLCINARTAVAEESNGDVGATGAGTSRQLIEAAPEETRTGLQVEVRTGAQFPFGKVAVSATRGDPDVDMSDAFSTQLPFVLVVGGNPTPHVLIGGYLGLGIGGPAGRLRADCSGAACLAVSTRYGLQIEYHVSPRGRFNPWFGYGIGLEDSAVKGDRRDEKFPISERVTGIEYGHFSGGLDIRIADGLIIGPMLDLGIGKYTHAKVEGAIYGYHPDIGAADVKTSDEGDVTNTAIHGWFMIGTRVVIFP